MSSLIVVCSHCLTWAEPQADRCTECGVAVDFDAPDPDEAALAQRVGEPLLELGPIRMNRRGWPSLGQLVATSEGLLFLPDFIARPNGAIEPRGEHPESAGRWTAPLSPSWWWPLSSRVASTRPVTFSGTDSAMPPPPFQRLLDAPGGLFVQRTSVRRLVAFWNHLHIERRPARRVTLHSVPGGVGVGELLRQLRGLSAWRGV